MNLDFTGSTLFLVLLLFAAGLVCIIKGGDFFVDAATWIAEASGIPKFIIGATVVSFATTMPEMLVSVFSALEATRTSPWAMPSAPSRPTPASSCACR